MKQCQAGIRDKAKAVQTVGGSTTVQKSDSSGGSGGSSDGSSGSSRSSGDSSSSGDSASDLSREWSWESVWDGSVSSVAALHHACRDISADQKDNGNHN